MAPPPVEIEARTYGPDASPAELEALRARVTLYKPGIVLYREIPKTSPFTINLMYDVAEALVIEHDCPFFLVDVREATKLPSVQARKLIISRAERLSGQIRHYCLVINDNPLIAVASRFVQAAMTISLSLHGSIEDAEETFCRVDE